jgi:hypothetical protein
MKKLFTKKIGFGRFSMPIWFAGLTILIISAAAGQAVGPVLAGGVQGSAGLVVEQSLVLDDDPGAHSVDAHTGDDAIITVNDEGTAFTAAIEMHIGDEAVLNLNLNNNSDADGNAILELNVPRGIDVEVDSSGDLDEAQLTRNSWVMTVDGESDGDIEITIEGKDDLKPGFYTISGRIVQVSN